MNNKWDKVYKYFCVAAPVFSVLTLGTIVGGLEAGTALLLSGIGTGVVSPIAYLGFNHFEKREKRERVNSSSYFLQAAKMVRENKEEYRLIHEDTHYFYDYIDRALNSGMMPTTLNLDEQSLENINQLVYLINTNYFHKINNNNNLKREQVINQVLYEIVRYLNSRKQNEFSHKDVKSILSNCSYIDLFLRKEILKEYKEGRFNFNGNVVYTVSKDINRYNGVSKSFLGEDKVSLDLNDSSSYSLIIESVCNSDEYKKLSNLEWDIDSLKYIIQVIDSDFGKEIERVRGNYNRLDLVTSFVTNTLDYIRKKDKKEVGREELMTSLREWGYLPKNAMLKSVELALIYEFQKEDSTVKNKEKSLVTNPSKWS